MANNTRTPRPWPFQRSTSKKNKASVANATKAPPKLMTITKEAAQPERRTDYDNMEWMYVPRQNWDVGR